MLVIFSMIVSIIIIGIRGSEVGEGFFPIRLLSQQFTCASTKQRGRQDIWNESKAKYSHLADERFTIAMLTYRRPKELNHTLTVLPEENIPSLYEIIVIRGDLEAELPMNFVSKYKVPVRFRMALKDSLNEKLRPDPDFKTQAILLADGDVYYRPRDVGFDFQTWISSHRRPRCSDIDAEGNYNYNFCSRKERDDYSMILTNLCFSHISFMDYYWSNDSTMAKIRDYVDGVFNCKDIALNYVQRLLTGQGPLQVNGRERYVNPNPAKGISTKPGHLEARSKCLNEFVKMFRCMPLVDETAHIQNALIGM
ncbi:Exostosin-like 3 [Fusarium oxysporum f. sp. cubense race 1]|uniref:Exostosin-like 3 n=1 Tax=Fusarium oxysporum f. sp. cubense (strain race 1) TaxID=1229664 RepID=N4URE7_FUSC1|nr:Exostosin-like 3 [Fusarium oxysporum f. sp. cubense race 1]